MRAPSTAAARLSGEVVARRRSARLWSVPVAAVGRAEADRRLGAGEPEAVDELRLLVGPEEEVDRGVAAAEAASRSASRTEQPVSTTRRPGLARFRLARWPWRPMTFCSAASRMAQVLITTRSAVLHRRRFGAARGEQAAGHLLRIAVVHLAAQRPDEEARQRLVFRPELLEAGVVGRARHGAGRRADGPGARRTGDVEDGQGAVHRAGVGFLERLVQPDRDLRRDPERGVRLGVGFAVAMVVAAPRGNESQLSASGRSASTVSAQKPR